MFKLYLGLEKNQYFYFFNLKTTNLIYTVEDDLNGADTSDSSTSTSSTDAPSGTSDPQYQ